MRSETMKLLKTWMTALCLACAVLLMQGGTALAALYQGDIGETRCAAAGRRVRRIVFQREQRRRADRRSAYAAAGAI